MSILSNLIATRKRTFNFLSGTNQLATISDVNKVINALNNLIPYRMYDVLITQTSTDAPVLTKLAAGLGECGGNCSSDCILCDCKTSPNCTNEKAGNFSVATSYVSPGVFDFTFTLSSSVYPRPIRNVGFFFGPLPSVESKIGITKISANVYRLTTADKSNAATNGLLTDTVIAMKIYF